MQEILPYLWIGNQQCANDPIGLHGKGIDTIVNCSREMGNCKVNLSFRIPVSASAGEYSHQCEVLYKYLPSAVEKIHSQIQSGSKVLICCPTGFQQSPTVAAAYIMKYGRVSHQIACGYITSKCSMAFMPDIYFRNSLDMYQKYLGNV